MRSEAEAAVVAVRRCKFINSELHRNKKLESQKSFYSHNSVDADVPRSWNGIVFKTKSKSWFKFMSKSLSIHPSELSISDTKFEDFHNTALKIRAAHASVKIVAESDRRAAERSCLLKEGPLAKCRLLRYWYRFRMRPGCVPDASGFRIRCVPDASRMLLDLKLKIPAKMFHVVSFFSSFFQFPFPFPFSFSFSALLTSEKFQIIVSI